MRITKAMGKAAKARLERGQDLYSLPYDCDKALREIGWESDGLFDQEDFMSFGGHSQTALCLIMTLAGVRYE